MIGFESVVEEAAIQWFRELGYEYKPGIEIAPDGDSSERTSYGQIVLEGRLRAALPRFNKRLLAETREEILRRAIRLASPSLEENNLAFHLMLTKGVEVQVRRDGGGVRGELGWLADFDEPDNNDWLVVNQFTVVEGKYSRRPDVVVFLNGLPIALFELKNPEDINADLRAAWNQFHTYKTQIPSLFHHNELVVVSDGAEAKVGSLTSGLERFAPWRTVDGASLAPDGVPKLEVLIKGLFDKRRLLDYLRHFVLFETDVGVIKKIAGYHQFHAVNKAVEATVKASRPQGNHRVGVVWHTQGSGKSITMTLYAGKIVQHAAMENPTLVLLTDRNDLDEQLFRQFAAARNLNLNPVRAESREHLRELLQVGSGGVVFTTIQKFGVKPGERFPLLSDRRNIVVIADEAHRSQYEFIEGFARNLRDGLPNASFIGFTGTPIEFSDKSTPAVFGEYIDVYNINRAVEDGATVRIFYEARLARIALPEDEKPRIDEEFEEVTEGEEEEVRGKLKSKWARIEAMVGTPNRLALIAADIVDHWERRREALVGKAMIVCMSRRICVDLYREIVKLRPAWHSDDDNKGAIKVVMTGAASDPPAFQSHIRNKPALRAVEKRFKSADDPLELVLVRDMWLTGLDVPSAHTMYLDKPMRGHTLMQAIARVNRVFRDKPSGLVVDYLGLAEQLRRAVGHYGGDRPEDEPGVNVEVALAELEKRVEVLRSMFHGFDYGGFFTSDATKRLTALTAGANLILGLEDGKKRYLDGSAALNKAAGIAIHLEDARHLRDEVGYFQTVRRNIMKYTPGAGGGSEQVQEAIRQIVSGAISSKGVVDIFDEAGLKKPDISILSDEFLETVKKSPYVNLQIELLKKLLNDEIRAQRRKNVVQSHKFSEMLAKTVLAYQNRSLEAAQVIRALIDMAQGLRDAPKRSTALGLTDDELAFYDALVEHGNVREVMGDEVLSKIARDLVEAIRASVTIDWTQKEAVRAAMRSKIKMLLRKHGYPPDKRQAAVDTVIEQAEQVCRDWAAAA